MALPPIGGKARAITPSIQKSGEMTVEGTGYTNQPMLSAGIKCLLLLPTTPFKVKPIQLAPPYMVTIKGILSLQSGQQKAPVTVEAGAWCLFAHGQLTPSRTRFATPNWGGYFRADHAGRG